MNRFHFIDITCWAKENKQQPVILHKLTLSKEILAFFSLIFVNYFAVTNFSAVTNFVRWNESLKKNWNREKRALIFSQKFSYKSVFFAIYLQLLLTHKKNTVEINCKNCAVCSCHIDQISTVTRLINKKAKKTKSINRNRCENFVSKKKKNPLSNFPLTERE